VLECDADARRSQAMRTLSALAANVFLFLTVASLMVLGGAIFAVILFFPLVLLALVGVMAGLEDRKVRQHDASPRPREWRDGS
jgi:archaellum biogenesis protein FlaJ (TadC family)